MKWASGGLVLLSLLATGPFACGGHPTPSTAAPTTSRLDLRSTFEDGRPIAGVSVVLGEVGSGVTDSNGQLSFEVPPGQYAVRLHLDAGDGRESKIEQSITVSEQLQLITLQLPRPVQLLEPLELTTSRVHLSWERSRESGFREYKIYARKDLPAVDEKNGQLVYEGTDASQTDYTLGDVKLGAYNFITAGSDIYFRVFVFREDGSTSGSNILHVKTPRWDNEPFFTRFYKLSIEQRFAGELPIHGITYDGSALWLLYREEVGGYDVDDKLTLVQLEPGTWRTLKEISFTDHIVPDGLTWDGEAFWISFLDGHLVRFNPTTGVRERTFTTSTLTSSLAWSGSQILQSKMFSEASIEGIDPLNGSVVSARPNPFSPYRAQITAGIAARPGEVWLANSYLDDLVIIDDAGAHVGVVSSSFHFAHMTFMDKQLVGVTSSSQVIIMNIQE